MDWDFRKGGVFQYLLIAELRCPQGFFVHAVIDIHERILSNVI
jgi:hypothetical protein